jgi:hypothetical protein
MVSRKRERERGKCSNDYRIPVFMVEISNFLYLPP